MTDSKKNENYINHLFKGMLCRAPRETELAHWVGKLKRIPDPRVIAEQIVASEEYKRIEARRKPLFVEPGHFYSPIVDVEQVRVRFSQQQPNVAPQSIRIDASAMRSLWRDLLPFLKDIPFPDEADPNFRYFFHNPAFGIGDGSILHAMLRLFRPKRLVEVGSGYSSACSIDTIDRYLDIDGDIHVDVSFVEPYPALLRKLLGQDRLSRCTVHATGVQETDMSVFKALDWGDILFIDSTHVMKTGSDVCYELFEVLPALKPGVLIHFHDIFWPFEYGSKWIIDDNRSWNEIYGLRSFLMYNEAFEIVFFNDWFARNEPDLILQDYPSMMNNTGGSIWLRKISG